MILFVAGAMSPNPADWSAWDEISLILAESKEQAAQFTDKSPILEVNTSKPALLVSVSEPQLGDDL